VKSRKPAYSQVLSLFADGHINLEQRHHIRFLLTINKDLELKTKPNQSSYAVQSFIHNMSLFAEH